MSVPKRAAGSAMSLLVTLRFGSLEGKVSTTSVVNQSDDHGDTDVGRLESIVATQDGLAHAQRSYSSKYPSTVLKRTKSERRAAQGVDTAGRGSQSESDDSEANRGSVGRLSTMTLP